MIQDSAQNSWTPKQTGGIAEHSQGHLELLQKNQNNGENNNNFISNIESRDQLSVLIYFKETPT